MPLQRFLALPTWQVSEDSRLSEGCLSHRVTLDVQGSMRAAKEPELTHCGPDVLGI